MSAPRNPAKNLARRLKYAIARALGTLPTNCGRCGMLLDARGRCPIEKRMARQRWKRNRRRREAQAIATHEATR